MDRGFYEVWKDGQPLHYLFFTEAQAVLWLNGHRETGAEYEIKPFSPW